MSTIFNIQALRAFAACLVVFHHSLDRINGSLNGNSILYNFYELKYFGAAGVDIFFIISGFIMVLTTNNSDRNLYAAKNFILKRIFRVVPLYWFYTTLLIALAIAFPLLFKSFYLEPIHVLGSYFFIPVLSYTGTDAYPILGVGWTLSYEMYFYLVFAILILVPKNIFLPSLILFFTTSVAFGFFANVINPVTKLLTNSLLLEFVAGCIVAFVILKFNANKFAYGFTAFALSCMLFIGTIFFKIDLDRSILWGIPSALLLYSLVNFEMTGMAFKNKIIQTLGNASYSIYLSHLFTIPAIIKTLSSLHITASIDMLVIFATITSAAVGVGLYFLIENPLTITLTQHVFIKNSLLKSQPFNN